MPFSRKFKLKQTTSTPIPSFSNKDLNIGAYWGSAGNANEYIPKITEIDDRFNILILSFLNFQDDDDGSLIYCNNCNGVTTGNPCTGGRAVTEADALIPCAKHYEFNNQPFTDADSLIINKQFYDDIKDFKNKPDPYGRDRMVLVSMGGALGMPFPGSNITAIKAFLDGYNLDGLDINLEGTGFGTKRQIEYMKNALQLLKTDPKNYKISAAPEAVSGILDPYYLGILPYLDWIWPQFYNDPPPGVTAELFPPCYTGTGDEIRISNSFQTEYSVSDGGGDSGGGCQDCFPGSSGPCQKPDKTCWALISGVCPGGTSLCPTPSPSNPTPNPDPCAPTKLGEKMWPWWAGIGDKLVKLANEKGNKTIQRGMTSLACNSNQTCKPAPSTPDFNVYDYKLLREQIIKTQTKYVATWAVAYDILNGNSWIDTITGGKK